MWIFLRFIVLYFFNYFEKLQYKNLSGYNVDNWKICYIRPSSQIIPVTNLSVFKLEKKVKALETEIYSLKKDIVFQKFKLLLNNLMKRNMNIFLKFIFLF